MVELREEKLFSVYQGSINMLENNGRYNWGKKTYVAGMPCGRSGMPAELWIKIEYK